MLRSVSASGGPPDSSSPELEAARRAAETIELCPRCEAPENQGLCHSEKCRRAVLPGLRGAAWQKDAHRGENDTDVTTEATVWSQTIDAIDKSQRRQAQLDTNAKRLTAAVSGSFTRNRPQRKAA